MADVDLHTHSRFFHSFPGRPTWYDKIGARLHVAVARARGLDGIAVTNHDYTKAFDFETGDVTIIPGIEVSSTAGHLLVIGPDPPEQTKPDMLTPQEVIDMAHDRDCVVVMAHPYRNSRIKDMDVAVDAIEVNGKRSHSTALLQNLAAERNLPLVGGSDAHYPIEVGRAFTAIDVETVTPGSVVDAIRDGRTDYRLVDRFPDRYIERLYALAHRLKGHTVPASVTAQKTEASDSQRSVEAREVGESSESGEAGERRTE